MAFQAYLSRLRYRADCYRRRRSCLAATEHLSGPRRVDLSEDGVMVTLLARDAGYFLREFLSHHFSLGAAHVLVIDNGSTDDTHDICRKHPRVSLLRNLLPVHRYESEMRDALSRSVAQGGWLLFADADEMIQFPDDRQNAASRHAAYCNRHGYTAVLGQMLDRIPARPLPELSGLDYRDALQALDCYSLEQIEQIAYNDPQVHFFWFLRENKLETAAIKLLRGGVRRELFGEMPFLSKHSMVRNRRGITRMSHPHCASGVRLADFTLLIQHYKLAGDWLARDRASVLRGSWRHGEDRLRLARAGATTALRPARPRKWRGIEALLDNGFLLPRNAIAAR